LAETGLRKLKVSLATFISLRTQWRALAQDLRTLEGDSNGGCRVVNPRILLGGWGFLLLAAVHGKDRMASAVVRRETQQPETVAGLLLQRDFSVAQQPLSQMRIASNAWPCSIVPAICPFERAPCQPMPPTWAS
jgi:hypothetical protein